MSTTTSTPTPRTSPVSKGVAIVAALLIGLGLMATSVPSASAAPARPRGRAPADPAPTRLDTGNPIFLELFALIKGRMEGSMMDEIEAGLGIGGDKSAAQFESIHRDIDQLGQRVSAELARAEYAQKIEQTKLVTASIDKLLQERIGPMAKLQTEMAELKKKADDPKLPAKERLANQSRLDMDRQQYDRLKDAYVREYAGSLAASAVNYFEHALSSEAGASGIIQQYRTVILADPSIRYLTPDHTAAVSNVLRYFESYQLLASMLNTLNNWYQNIEDLPDRVERVTQMLDRQEALLPRPIHPGTVIVKDPHATSTRNAEMWVTAATSVTFDERLAGDPPKTDASYWVNRMNNSNQADYDGWRLPNGDQVRHLMGGSPLQPFQSWFLRTIGLDATDADGAIWTNYKRADQYTVWSRTNDRPWITTHEAMLYMPMHDPLSRGLPALSTHSGYYWDTINKLFANAKATVLMVRNTGPTDFM